MSAPKLFEPTRVANRDSANRIIIAPMCQCTAEDRCMADWHVVLLDSFALSGAATPNIEATEIKPEGRISYANSVYTTTIPRSRSGVRSTRFAKCREPNNVRASSAARDLHSQSERQAPSSQTAP